MAMADHGGFSFGFGGLLKCFMLSTSSCMVLLDLARNLLSLMSCIVNFWLQMCGALQPMMRNNIRGWRRLCVEWAQ